MFKGMSGLWFLVPETLGPLAMANVYVVTKLFSRYYPSYQVVNIIIIIMIGHKITQTLNFLFVGCEIFTCNYYDA